MALYAYLSCGVYDLSTALVEWFFFFQSNTFSVFKFTSNAVEMSMYLRQGHSKQIP
jgi:hypothetical protein